MAVLTTADKWSPPLPGVQEASSKLVTVQVLRAAAALAVVLHHAQFDAETLAARFGLPYRPSDLLPWPAGVDVFFVISGFIMVYTSRRLFATADGPRVFLARRIARIVPIYWVLTTLYIVIGYVIPTALNNGVPGLSEIVKSFLFIPFAQANGAIHPVLLLGWTLNYEMFFYILFAVMVLLPRPKAIAAVAAVLFGIVIVGQLTQFSFVPLAFWSEPIVLEFVFGMGVAVAAEQKPFLTLAWRLALVAAALALLHLDLVRQGGTIVLPQVLAYGIPATMLVAAAVLGGDDGPVGLPAVGRALCALGDASYALYLAHPFAIRAMREVFAYSDLASATGLGVFVTLSTIAAVALAFFVYLFIERPLTRAARGAFGV